MAAEKTLRIAPEAFFSAEEKPAEFEEILHDAIKGKRAITVQFEPDALSLSSRGLAGEQAGLVLRGAWSTADLQDAGFDDIGTRLFLPFVFNIGVMSLRHDQIFTFGHPYRSIADFFMRNLLLGITRNADLVCRPDKIVNRSAAQALREQFFFILKAMMTEPALTRRGPRETIDYLRASLYVPVMHFENALLGQGAERLRAERLRRATPRSDDELVARLNTARRAMLDHLTA